MWTRGVTPGFIQQPFPSCQLKKQQTQVWKAAVNFSRFHQELPGASIKDLELLLEPEGEKLPERLDSWSPLFGFYVGFFCKDRFYPQKKAGFGEADVNSLCGYQAFLTAEPTFHTDYIHELKTQYLHF